MPHRPEWFADGLVMTSTAATCGITKGGRLLPRIDPATGRRIRVVDPETGGWIDDVDDQLLHDMEALVTKGKTDTLQFVSSDKVDLRAAVPVYYDLRHEDRFAAEMKKDRFQGFRSARIGELITDKRLTVRNGHGSPSHDQRIGSVPYIKVSDLRAGLVNINPTNRVPHSVARKFWKNENSGLRAFDLLCPERTSKNIGDFCILMPGQERVVLTKEIIVLRPGPKANFDPFYLLWALTLKIVRDQWKRVVFMQTNREDVGKRYEEIKLPIPPDSYVAASASRAFRDYYVSLADARIGLAKYLEEDGGHHFFVSGAEEDKEAEMDELVLSDTDGA